ncbi:MAG: hypothetical protein CL666_09950 [Balneola sp.]|nr:hypothetical protein [Balneola sp.]|tara:strand:+ start:15799 stop:16371 length:573 start_codon:yes stop_codon:yes gene_type:complete
MLRKTGLFILSLWLLFFLIIIITVEVPFCWGPDCQFIGFVELVGDNIISLICLVALMLGAFSYWDFSYKIKDAPELSFKITSIKNIDYEHLTFLTTYIIPLVCFQFDDVRYQAVFIIILTVIGIIYVRTDLFYANPTLAILRFKLFKVSGDFRSGESRSEIILITRDQLNLDDRVKYLKLDDRIYYAYKV